MVHPRMSSKCRPFRLVSCVHGHGFAGLSPIVNSGEAFNSYWHQSKRVLDQLQRKVNQLSPSLELLETIDQMELIMKNMHAKSRHAASRHRDTGWRRIGAHVSQSVLRFSNSFYSPLLLKKVEVQRTNLLKQLEALPECSELRESVQLSLELADAVLCSRFDGQALECETGGIDLDLSFLAGGPALDLDQSPEWSQVRDLEAEERRIVALFRRGADETGYFADFSPWGSFDSWLGDPLIKPLLVPQSLSDDQDGAIVSLNRLDLVKKALSMHPNSSVRQEMYQRGLLPRKMRIMHTFAALSRVRYQIANLKGYRSYAQLIAVRGGLSLPYPQQMDLLDEMTQSIKPLVEIQSRILKELIQEELEAERVNSTAEEESTSSPVLAPWDLSYGHQSVLKRLFPSASGIFSFELCSVISGISRLMKALIGVELNIVPWGEQVPRLEAKAPEETERGIMGFAFEEDIASASIDKETDEPQWCTRGLKIQLDDLLHAGSDSFLGVTYLDLGGAYGARQLHFSSEHPVVSIGLKWNWNASGDGLFAESLSCLPELLHEIGHAVHLILSSRRKGYKSLDAFSLPLDILETPSTLMERMCCDPKSLSMILDPEHAHLAGYFQASLSNAIDLDEAMRMTRNDLQLNLHDGQDERHIWQSCSLMDESINTLRQLEIAPVIAFTKGRYSAYLVAALFSSSIHKHQVATLLEDDGSGKEYGQRKLRQSCFETSGSDSIQEVIRGFFNGEEPDVASFIHTLWHGGSNVA